MTSLGPKQVQLLSVNSFTRDMCLKKLSIVSSSFVGHGILGNKLLEELEISKSHVQIDDDEDPDFLAFLWVMHVFFVLICRI